MTEAEWLACTDLTPLLEYMQDESSERQRRLVGVACCRRIWDLMLDARCRKAVEASEQFADGLIAKATLDHRSAAAEEAMEEKVPDDERPGLSRP